MFKKLMLSTLLIGFGIINAINPLAQHPDAYSVNLNKPEVLAIAHWRNLTIQEAFRQGLTRIAFIVPILGVVAAVEALALGGLYCYKKYTSEDNNSLQNQESIKELIQNAKEDFKSDLKYLEKRLTRNIDNCVKKYPDLIDEAIIL